jgi:hypothetical protein
MGVKNACKMLVGNPEGRRHSEYLGVDGSVILKRKFGKWGWGVDWIHLAQDRDRWCSLVNTVKNLKVLLKGGGIS